MSRSKIIIAAILLTASLGVAVFVVSEGKKSLDPSRVESEATKTTLSEPLANLNGINSKTQTEKVEGLSTTDPTQNTTEDLAEKFAKAIVEKNPNGPQNTDGSLNITAIDPEKLVNDALKASEDAFALSKIIPIVTAADVNVTAATDNASITTYLKATQATLAQTAGAHQLNLKNPSAENFNEFAGAVDEAVAAFYRMPVPLPVASLHAESIALMRAQVTIFHALGRADEDPAGALAALKSMKLLEDEFTKLTNNYLLVIKSRGITF